jgi:hypothetical protein
MIMHGRCAGPMPARWPNDLNSAAIASEARETSTATMHNNWAHIVALMNGHA